jgi:hypothetical protein
MSGEGDNSSEKKLLIEKLLSGSASAKDLGELGLMYASANQHGAAIATLKKAVDLGAGDASTWAALASAYHHAGLYQRAENLMRQLISIGLYTGWTLMEYGRLLVKMGQQLKAIEFFTPLSSHADFSIAIASRAVLVESYSTIGELNRAAALGDQASIWPHMFAASACNRIRQVALGAGVSLSRSDHEAGSDGVGVSIDSLGYHGRLGHTLVEYLHIRDLADRVGVPVETPDWIGHMLFELDDPPIRVPRSFTRKTPLQLQTEVERLGSEALCGLDLFSPGAPVVWTDQISAKAREIFRFRSFLLPYLEHFLAQVRQQGRTLIAFHVRLGDRESHTMENQNPSFYVNWLNDNWGKFKEPVLYIGSDDISKACEWFSAYRPVNSNSFALGLPDLDWLFDFFLFMHADIVGVSQSSFSLLACVLNPNRSAIFLRPDLRAGSLRPFSVESNSGGWC